MAARAIAGLTVSSIDSNQIAPALGQADAIFASVCAHQIASSQRFFVNLPFPLSGVREAGTPVYSWHDDRVTALLEVIRIAAAQFGVTDDLDRANVIVREYKPGQRIPFHIDDELCGPRVFGIILANGSAAHGLVLAKDGASYAIYEEPGTCFLLEEQARYSWRHGLPAVPARRVSVTVRFFKPGVTLPEPNALVERARRCADELALSQPAVVAVTLIRNAQQSLRKAATVGVPILVADVMRAAKNKLQCKPRRLFVLGGRELADGDHLPGGSLLYISAGEAYSGPAATAGVTAPASARGCARGWDSIAAERKLWEAWRYPRLVFSTRAGASGEPLPAQSVAVADATELGTHLERASRGPTCRCLSCVSSCSTCSATSRSRR